ncbi:MAG: FAD-binding oxidoreductase [Sphingobacteriales bacterium]|nr:FAD-binding oxidoreductase [Sphingobacteriales bacterium]
MDYQNRNFWGWGYKDFNLPDDATARLLNALRMGLGIKEFNKIQPVTLNQLRLREPRFKLTEELTLFCSRDTEQRAGHSYGKSFRDVWRGMNGIFPNPPDYVAYPKNENQISTLFDFAATNHIALIPFGGGSSVCGGVEPLIPPHYNGCITVDMLHFDKVLEVDKTSRSARIQAGIFGLDLEQQLKGYGLTLRHFPQSLEFSTLGGWIATRSGGHFATLFTHIDEFVQSVRMMTPTGGILHSRRLPGSGAGPSEERLVCGSEGTLGIITEAWMRLQDIPTCKATATLLFRDFAKGAEACRLLSQSGLNPSNARLISALEAFSNGLGDGVHTVLILGFESAHFAVDDNLKKATALCLDAGGTLSANASFEKTEDPDAMEWKKSFIRAPYIRDLLMCHGLIAETFETAVTWDKFTEFHNAVEQGVYCALKQQGMQGIITCRFTHIYPDGPAPYYTVIAKGKPGQQLEEWDFIKKTVSEILIEKGGTITHHHAVGRDHRPYYKMQSSATFQQMLKHAKTTVDAGWILNPGALINKEA